MKRNIDMTGVLLVVQFWKTMFSLGPDGYTPSKHKWAVLGSSFAARGSISSCRQGDILVTG